jgi:hypothetical protein
MRALVILLALAAAAPAAAQTTQFDLDYLRAQQQAAQQREVAQHNELMALEARLRAEQAVVEQQLARVPVRVPEPPYASPLPPAKIDTSKLPSIPDATLADSNRRVQEAAGNRR